MVAAFAKIVNMVAPTPFPSVSIKGWAANCSPQPATFAATDVAHSDIRKRSFGEAPNICRSTCWPSRRFVGGVNRIFGRFLVCILSGAVIASNKVSNRVAPKYATYDVEPG